MSLVSKNPFDILGDDGDDSSSPAPAKVEKKPEAAPAPQRNVPGAAPKNDKPAGNGSGRGRNAPRGGARGGYRGEGQPRNTGPTADEGVTEGAETAGGFDGERIAPSRKFRGDIDRHTKGPRGTRPNRGVTSGGHTSRGGSGGARTPAQGGERRQFERKSGGLPDSQKKIEHGWGSNEGGAELGAELEGEKDAEVEEAQTPAGEDGGWAAPDAAPAAEATPDAAAEPEEPEEVQKSYDEFLAERTAAALSAGLGKKEVRTVNSETLEGKAFVRETIDEFFSGKEKAAAAKAKAPKKEKIFIEVDGQFSSPAGRPTRGTGERGGRGGRGAGRGRGEGRGRGAPRGGASRGGARSGPGFNGQDQSAFPALGA
ncbi:hypothetical protein BCR39DRAFT_532456 [Naematelia encephala]|uniref:Hyaluronan/mRNA-binding protein domain-containing protein n=1 Tax=Naematelia encephala TaxID=71784 RepID=A0A1Y2B3E2_9TREE|nr:hypothetical protein BCR39DRAFT_532456 [Naematelia encephala]